MDAHAGDGALDGSIALVLAGLPLPNIDTAIATGSQARPFQPMLTTPRDIAAIVERLAPGPDNSKTLLRIVRCELNCQGLAPSDIHLKGWTALLRPELFAVQWPGLQAFRDDMLAACRGDPALLDDRAAFRRLIAEQAATVPRLLRSFLAVYEAPLIHYLIQDQGEATAERQRISRLMGTDQADSAAKLRSYIAPHAQDILDCVNTMAAQGFATSSVEIDMLLMLRQLRLNLRQMHKLGRLLPGLECRHGWLFPKGQSPRKFMHYRLDDENMRIFRGEASAGIVPDGRAGFAHCLQQAYPAGGSLNQCLELLEVWAPTLDASARLTHLHNFRSRGLLVSARAGRLAVNPDLVCRRTRELILRGTPGLGPAAGQGCAAAAEPASPADEQPAESAAPEPAPYGLTEAVMTFECLLQARDEGRLGDYLGRDLFGREIFQLEAIRQALRPARAHPRLTAIKEALKGLTPARLDDTLAARQWQRPRVAMARLPARLVSLARELPLLAFAGHSQIAAHLNRHDPTHFCTSAMVTDLVKRQKHDGKATARAIADLAARKLLHLFVSADGRRPNLTALRMQLILSNAGLDRPGLQTLLRPYRHLMILRRSRLIDAGLWNGSAGLRETARRLKHSLGLRQGDPLPDWKRYMEHFHQLLCQRGPGEQPLLYTGLGAMRIYAELEQELGAADEPAPTTKRAAEDGEDAAPAKRARIETPDAAPAAPAPPAPAPWNAFEQRPQLRLKTLFPGRGGLYELVCAIGNALQDPDAVESLEGLADCEATLDLALHRLSHAPGESKGVRSTPDGQGWALLQLSARQWQAGAADLLNSLDMAVVQRGAGEFAALRRGADSLWLLHAQQAEPQQAPPPGELALADGRFAAALPAAACRGAIGRQLSYQAIAGFAAACDAIAELTGDAPPLDDFARWLDDPFEPTEGMPHEPLDALRRRLHPFIGLEQVTQYLQERHGQAWVPGEALPSLLPWDDAQSLMPLLELFTRGMDPAQAVLLALPGTPHVLVVRQQAGMPMAQGDAGPQPLQELLAWIAQGLQDLQEVECYWPCDTDLSSGPAAAW
ncbi:hypothetical protein GT347_18320 [Xylophilus rhododendri]|uniref:Uncharacterized protein n=1 Tax=Xylophilus rhododendri TaxID=2697032 RepID=A0A857J9H8_9BURK|nr:hypothetical protein [Xylophilus rhododendri]QHI99761.1 hypothetical protein GT347_18320 [Xylophilus rhododendri]